MYINLQKVTSKVRLQLFGVNKQHQHHGSSEVNAPLTRISILSDPTSLLRNESKMKSEYTSTLQAGITAIPDHTHPRQYGHCKL
jgi:hypothetical protein